MKSSKASTVWVLIEHSFNTSLPDVTPKKLNSIHIHGIVFYCYYFFRVVTVRILFFFLVAIFSSFDDTFTVSFLVFLGTYNASAPFQQHLVLHFSLLVHSFILSFSFKRFASSFLFFRISFSSHSQKLVLCY